MRNWKKYIIALALIAGFAGGWKSAFVVSTADDELSEVFSVQTVLSAFSSQSNPFNIPGEEPSLMTVGHSPVPFSMNVKDYQKYIADPFTENRTIEHNSQSYLFYTRIFLASETLYRLRRLNI